MTWKEFKDAVEKQGVRDEDVISWIDLGGDNGVEVERYDGDGSVTIHESYGPHD